MLPVFPQFEQLSIHHKDAIEKITNKYPPYSDFYFLSLWSWNIHNKTEVSFKDDCFIMKINDYVSSVPVYSYIGNGGYELVCDIFKLIHKNGGKEIIKYVPEQMILFDKKITDNFIVTEDYDNYDYILSSEAISTMNGKELHQKKKKLNKFILNFHYTVIHKNISDTNLYSEIMKLFSKWQTGLNKSHTEVTNELKALDRLISNATYFGEIPVICIYDNSELIGFSIYELLPNQYSIGSFQKVDRKYEGISEYLNQQIAIYTLKNGGKYINIEQDLGIPGLRRAKQDYNPTFLKKFIITR